jgi:hypothetical protein
MKTYFIYALGDPRDGELRYVGYTKDPDTRYKNHCANQTAATLMHSGKRGVVIWETELKSLNLSPVLVRLETIQAVEKPRDREAYWISSLLQRGHRLLNHQNRQGRWVGVEALSDDAFSDAMKKLELKSSWHFETVGSEVQCRLVRDKAA